MFKLKKPRSRKAPVVMRKNEDARVKVDSCNGPTPLKAKAWIYLKRLGRYAAYYWLKQGLIYLWDNCETILAFIGIGS